MFSQLRVCEFTYDSPLISDLPLTFDRVLTSDRPLLSNCPLHATITDYSKDPPQGTFPRTLSKDLVRWKMSIFKL